VPDAESGPESEPARGPASLAAAIDLVDKALKWIDKIAWIPMLLTLGALLGAMIAIGLAIRSQVGWVQLVVLVIGIAMVAMPATASRRLRRAGANRALAIDELRELAKSPSAPVRAAMNELGVNADALLHGSTVERLRAGVRLADPVADQLRDAFGHVATVAMAASAGLQLLAWSVLVVPAGIGLALVIGLAAFIF